MQKDIIHDTEDFRDHLATVDNEGKRIWIYPKKPKGRFYNARIWVSLAFLTVFLVLPFIKVNGEQILLFNVLEAKFVIFGLLFSPHDFYLFFLVMLTFLVFIILFTVVWGRLFCGWVCPQTVFMEMIFRRIEYWIEGDGNDQRRLDKADWTPDKIRKKVLKHAIFFAIGVVVANYFLAYIIGMDNVLKIIKEPIALNIGGFAAMIGFSFVFYGVFARLREQVCTTICPYGRLQSVLLVPDSIVVAYDYMRGEPRGKLKKEKKVEPKAHFHHDHEHEHHDHHHDHMEHPDAIGKVHSDKKEPCKNACSDCATCAATASILQNIETHLTPKLGDCIDCTLCVQVCPTGIDIRNGTQLECVNCTACIDACDEVMDKIERPRGLIRYDSLNGIKNGKRKIWTPRAMAYSGVLGLMMLLDIVLLARRSDVDVLILRSPGQMFQQVDEGHISNLYTYQIVNKTNQPMPIHFKIKDNLGKIKLVGNDHPEATKEKIGEGAFFVEMDVKILRGVKTELFIEVFNGEKLVHTVKTSFVGPLSFDDDEHDEKGEKEKH
jgi:polyferredoxin